MVYFQIWDSLVLFLVSSFDGGLSDVVELVECWVSDLVASGNIISRPALSASFLVLESDTVLDLDEIVDVVAWVDLPHAEWDEEHWDDPEESSSPQDSGVPSGIESEALVLELSNPSEDVDDEDENGDDDLEEEIHELWDLLSGSQSHEGLKVVEAEQESDEHELAHQAEEELDVSGVAVEQVEDVESSLNAEHEGPDEAEEAHDDAPDFLFHLLLDLWEEVLRELHEEVDESEDGVDSQAEAHGEEDHTEEVLPWEQSEKGGEHDEEELGSGSGELEHWDFLLAGDVSEE